MAGTLIEVNVNDKEVRDLLSKIQDRIGNLRPAMKIIGQILKRSVNENFMVGGRPKKWKPLSPVTLYQEIGGKKAYKKSGELKAWAIRRLKDRRILMKTERLFDSIEPEASDNSVLIGTNVEYAAIHQFGGKTGRGKKITIPARPFLLVQDEDWDAIKETLKDYLLME